MREGYGVCPVCNGTGRESIPASLESCKNVIAGYDKDTDTLPCKNCGGQYMYSKPSGEVRLNKEGVPCKHKYIGNEVGRCLTQYVCEHCGDRYQIDSGD